MGSEEEVQSPEHSVCLPEHQNLLEFAKPGRKLLNDKISILSPSSQAKNKIKPLCQAHFCCNHTCLSGVNGVRMGLYHVVFQQCNFQSQPEQGN